MAPEYDHDTIVNDLALLIEKDSKYALVKYWVPWGDAKTDLVGPYYPDLTMLRREGRQKLMIELQTPYSFEDSDEVRRLESLSDYCSANQWEFYIVCPDQKTRELTQSKIIDRKISPKAIWLIHEVPFQADKQLPSVS